MSTYVIDVTKLVEIFCEVDDFCKIHDQWKQSHAIGANPSKAGRKPSLSRSEIITILVFYHYSGMKNFQYYYERFVPALKAYFPLLVSYTQFLSLISKVLPELWCLLTWKCSLSKKSGTYYIDSKQLPVCHIRRAPAHRVFGSLASKEKSSTGWFFGLKLHLLINHQGEAMRFLLTPANVADNNEAVMKYLLAGVQGSCYGDKGYLSKLFEWFYENGLHLVTKARGNMKRLPCSVKDAVLLRKRGLIESVLDILTSVLDIEHTRHRKPDNAFANIFAGLTAYMFMDKKPSINQKFKLLSY